MNDRTETQFVTLFERRPELAECRAAIEAAFEALRSCFRSGGKLLVCGNGGSAADSEHIVGELMKGFRKPRPLPENQAARLREAYGAEGETIARRLQGALPAISLVSQVSLCSAIANDVSADMVFAQQVFGYGRRGDTLLAISTSGSAGNVVNAVKVARALELKTIALTGERGGRLASLCEVAIQVPDTATGADTARIQEYHLAAYHALCAALEAEFFPG